MLCDFQPAGSLPSNDVKIVVWMDHPGAGFSRDVIGDLFPVLGIPIILDNFGSRPAGSGLFDLWGINRHDNGCRHAEKSRGFGDTLSMIAGRTGDDTSFTYNIRI